jgi:hypothetical protein
VALTQEERAALALAALGEVTDPNDVGELLGMDEIEAGVIDVRFACRLTAYTGWHWTVSTSDLPDDEMTVLEVELLPGDGALLAPPWVPWTERLADWRRQHPDELHPDEADDDVADLDGDPELDEDDLAVDDELDELDDVELDEAELDEDEGSDGSEQDTDDDEPDDTDDEAADDDGSLRGPRPAEVDRSL